jgi:hypothetical protein
VKPSQFAVLVFGAAICLVVVILLGGVEPLRIALGDLLSLPDYARQATTAEKQMRDLEVELTRVRTRHDRKVEAIHDLLDARATLLETVRRFQELDEESRFRDAVSPGWTCATRDECYALTVLVWAESELARLPRNEETRRRLEAELEALTRRRSPRP